MYRDQYIYIHQRQDYTIKTIYTELHHEKKKNIPMKVLTNRMQTHDFFLSSIAFLYSLLSGNRMRLSQHLEIFS